MGWFGTVHWAQLTGLHGGQANTEQIQAADTELQYMREREKGGVYERVWVFYEHVTVIEI